MLLEEYLYCNDNLHVYNNSSGYSFRIYCGDIRLRNNVWYNRIIVFRIGNALHN